MRILTFLTLILAMSLPFSGVASAKKASSAEAQKEKPMERENYILVLLRKGSAWTGAKSERLDKLMEGHLSHLREMGERGLMVIAGPLSDQDDDSIRGICLYKVADVEKARQLASEDPAVKSGHLKVEAMRWWVEKGYMEFPKAPEKKR